MVERQTLPPVAPLAGSVDRNGISYVENFLGYVAPLAGSVDRNLQYMAARYEQWVAPLAGSVDRNFLLCGRCFAAGCRSPRGERG